MYTQGLWPGHGAETPCLALCASARVQRSGMAYGSMFIPLVGMGYGTQPLGGLDGRPELL